MPLPIDIQVMMTKATEHSENLSKVSTAAQMVQAEEVKKIEKESREIDEKVIKMDQYEGSFTRVQKDGRQPGQNPNGQEEEEKHEPEGKESFPGYHPAPREEGTGNQVDIID